MPTVTLKKISKTQPMREGEIALLDYINGDMKTYLEEETQERVDGNDNLQTELDAEIQRATKAEETLQGNIEAEETRAIGKETELQQHIEVETSRAITAETELSGKIKAEETRATQAEAVIEKHIHTAKAEIEGKIAALDGNGLTYDTDTGKLNVKQADQQTFGGVKLKHDVDDDTSDEWAVTSSGVYKYAPSKAETVAQPESFEFTDVQAGVTLTVQNIIRACGIMFMNLRVQCGTDATVSSDTKFATPPNSVGGVGIGTSMSGIGIQISQVSLIVSKALEPNSDTYFTVVFPYRVNGGN